MIIPFLSRLWFLYIHSSWDCMNSQITSNWLFSLTCLYGCRRDFCTHSSVAQILACVSCCKGLRSCLQQKVLLAELWADYNLYTLHWKNRGILAGLPLPAPNILYFKVHFGKKHEVYTISIDPNHSAKPNSSGTSWSMFWDVNKEFGFKFSLIPFFLAHHVFPILWHSHFCCRFPWYLFMFLFSCSARNRTLET